MPCPYCQIFRCFAGLRPVTRELCARINDAEALALEVVLRTAGGLRDAHGEVASGGASGFETRRNKSRLRATLSKLGQRARSKQARDSLAHSERASADGFS